MHGFSVLSIQRSNFARIINRCPAAGGLYNKILVSLVSLVFLVRTIFVYFVGFIVLFSKLSELKNTAFLLCNPCFSWFLVIKLLYINLFIYNMLYNFQL